MENGQNEVRKDLPGKKEMKKQLADKIENALPELKEMLGEKRFANRLKKAAKLLMEGLHKEDLSKKEIKAASNTTPTNKTAAKKKAIKKVVVKNTTAKAAPPKKAKAAKKASTSK